MLLSLRFRPDRRASSCYDVAAVLEDMEAVYFAVPRALATEEPVQRHVVTEHRARFEETLGWPDLTLAEIEYRVRAIRQLEVLGADERTLTELRAATHLLAEGDVKRVVEGQRPRATAPQRPARQSMNLRRMTMESPLQIVVSIPAEYWADGTALVLFLGAIERRFNMVGRIRTERVDLEARRAERRADAREADLRAARTEQALAELQARREDSPLLEGLGPSQQQFELESGELLLADVAQRQYEPRGTSTTQRRPQGRPADSEE
jgi:hypothetical protein